MFRDAFTEMRRVAAFPRTLVPRGEVPQNVVNAPDAEALEVFHRLGHPSLLALQEVGKSHLVAGVFLYRHRQYPVDVLLDGGQDGVALYRGRDV